MTQDRMKSLTLSAQERLFRLAARNHGLSLKVISLESGIHYETIRSYAGHKGKQAMMPISAVNLLSICIPDYLLSLLFEPCDRHLAENMDDEGDHDTLASNCIDFASKQQRARHPLSPAGVDYAPCEEQELREARQQLRAKA